MKIRKLIIENLRSGFTLLEIVLSVGILIFIGTFSFVSFRNSRSSEDLLTAGHNVLTVIRDAQSKTLAGQDNASWGVHVQTGQAVLFRGISYASATSTAPYALPPSITIDHISFLGGGSDIVFKRLLGATDQSGTFDLLIRGSSQPLFSITIDPSGMAYQTRVAPAVTNTRIVDLRHRSFALGWSIKNAVTLTLTFSDPPNSDTIQTVAMTPLAPRTAFDWSGTVAVGGQNQTLRIHALSITDLATTLSIDRDCRRNTKKVKIAIDTKDIATYEADCQTIAVGAFGGVMMEP